MARSYGKVLKVWLVRFSAVAIAMAMMATAASADTSIVLQGYQIQVEKYAANTADAYVRALQTRPGAEVTALRPQSQPGWEGGESYTDKAAMLGRLQSLALGKADLVLVLIGDADGPGDTFRISAEEGVSASELADAVSGAARLSLVSAGCNAIAMDVVGKLPDVTRASVVISGVGSGEVAYTWPMGNRGQYDLFSRYLIGGFYLLATNSGINGSTSDLIGKAHHSARLKTIRTSGGRQTTASYSNYGDPPAQTSGPIISVGNREYVFNLQDLGNGSLTGYVGNVLGLPIAPIISARNDETASFSFVERGRERAVTIADVSGVPAVTIDGKPERFSYRATRVDLVSSGRHIGVTYVTPMLGKAPATLTYLANGKSAAKVVYDADRHALSLQLPQDRGLEAAAITFGPLGDVQVQVGSSTYAMSRVLRYGLYSDSGDRLASAVAVWTDGKLNGEVLPVMSEMRLPIDARIEKGDVLGSATLVGNTFTFASGGTWESNRPPAKGVVQSDFFELPVVNEVFADDSSGEGHIEISWGVENATMSGSVLPGDLRFQVARTERFNNKSVSFDVPAGRRQYADRPSGDARSFDYAVRAILDHRVTSCAPGQSFPILGDAVAAVSGRPAPKPSPEPTVVARSTTSAIAQADAAPEPIPEAVKPSEPTETEKPRKKEPEKKDESAVVEEEESGLAAKIRKKQEGESLGGKIVYGILGVLVVIGLAIALGGGGGAPTDMEPG